MDLRNHVTALAALRRSSVKLNYQLIARFSATIGERDEVLEAVRAADATWDEDDPNAVAQFYRGPQIRALLDDLASCEGEDVDSAMRLLRQDAMWAELHLQKAKDRAAYVAGLRCIEIAEVEEALRNGTVVNAWDEQGRPQSIRNDEDYSGAFLDAPIASATVDAKVLTEVIQRFSRMQGDDLANPQGLRLHRVIIRGSLNLNWVKSPFPLGFEGCDFYGWLSLDSAELPGLSFHTCDFTPYDNHVRSRPAGDGAFNAASLVTAKLTFFNCTGLGQIFIPSAKIGSYWPNSMQFSDLGELGGDGHAATDRGASNATGDSCESPRSPWPDFRVVVAGARFGTLQVPADGEFAPFALSADTEIERLALPSDDESPRVSAAHVYSWLSSVVAGGGVPLPEVVEHIEAALRRSGQPRVASEFGVLAADERARSEGRRGLVKRVLLKYTVRYFYDNLLAMRWLVALFLTAWVTVFLVATLAPEQFVQSPLANPSRWPAQWLGSPPERVVGSFLFATDLTFSPLALGLTQAVWPLSPWLAAVFALFKGLSLLLLGLYITGVTGLAERRARA